MWRLGISRIGGIVEHRQLSFAHIITGGKPLAPGGGDLKIGIVHLKRGKNAAAQEFREALAGNLLHQIAGHVQANGIIPHLARREFQGQFLQIRDHGRKSAFAVGFPDMEFAIGGVEIGAVEEAVGQPGGVAQQIHHLHRFDVGGGKKGAQRAAGINAEIGEARNIARYRIVQPDAAFLHQHQHRHRGDRLGHGIDAEDGVLAHGRFFGQIERTAHPLPDQFAASPDQGQRAGNGALFHIIVGDDVADALQAHRIEALVAAGSGHEEMLYCFRVWR